MSKKIMWLRVRVLAFAFSSRSARFNRCYEGEKRFNQSVHTIVSDAAEDVKKDIQASLARDCPLDDNRQIESQMGPAGNIVAINIVVSRWKQARRKKLLPLRIFGLEISWIPARLVKSPH
ncbi:hypothetical protein C8R47DRAFT_253535 [Mycena vitilis]|nr:hypothetical protein C8R47DRAFT_253535 [Mycena vitilis]